jgi:transcriptional regulator with XRE-family HTH domain
MDSFRLLAWNIRKLRRQQGLTQEALVGTSGLANARAVSDLERVVGNPTLQSIIDAAYGLGVPVAQLFSTEGAPSAVIDTPERATKVKETSKPIEGE